MLPFLSKGGDYDRIRNNREGMVADRRNEPAFLEEVIPVNPDLEMVRKINGLAGRVRPFDLMMDLIARYGHWAFVIYGLLLWFVPGGNRQQRRRCCILSFLGVCTASLISFAIGKMWFRGRPFTRDYRIWNFTGHRANASFPSNHTMNGAVVVWELLSMHMAGSRIMSFMAAILAFSRLFAGVHYPSDLLGGLTIAGGVHWLLHRPFFLALSVPVTAFSSFLSDEVIRKVKGR